MLNKKKKEQIIKALKKAKKKYNSGSDFCVMVNESIDRAIGDLEGYIKYWDGKARIEYLTGIKV